MKKLKKIITDWLNAENVQAGDTGGNIGIMLFRYAISGFIIVGLIMFGIYKLWCFIF